MTRRKALLIVDVQNDFLPGGALGVPDGDQIVSPIVREVYSGKYDLVLATQDWHPFDHASFQKNGGPFPVHCLQNSYGAALEWRIQHLEDLALIMRKGLNPTKDELAHPQLDRVLIAYDAREVHIVGLAREYCVLENARLLAQDGGSTFNPTVHWDMTRAVDPKTDEATRKALNDLGVKIT